MQLCRMSVHRGAGRGNHVADAESALHSADFFCDFVGAPGDLTFFNRREFRFRSAVTTPWEETNWVFGRLYHCGSNWTEKPAAILLHGWNAENGYRMIFPYLAARLVRAGVNVAMIELPYHCQRKPRGKGAVKNFLSDDLVRVVEAMRQSIADTRSLIAWLSDQGCPLVGVWGISLGAWIGGLVACVDDRAGFAVLTSPVTRMDRIVRESTFCAPIRRSLKGAAPRMERLNLATHRPQTDPGNILIVECEHDLFAPVETVEELWHAWDKPEVWRIRHGHISVLLSVPVMERTLGWIARRAGSRN